MIEIANKILFPFDIAKNHFKAFQQETEWKGRIVHLIVGVLECIFPINYIIAIFDRSVFKETLVLEKTPLSFSKNTPESSDIIGIDLGTTNSCVAILKNGAIEVLSDKDNHRTTPSVISYSGDEPVVGNQAKDRALEERESTLYSTKRFIGRKYDEVLSEIGTVPYKVIKNEEGNPVFEINGKRITPEEAAAQILIQMKQIAEKRLGRKITKAIVTVPAYFNDTQRQATREAGRIAGLDVVRIIAEPTAAALAYGVDQNPASQNVAVYDLGGGTFDVSVLNIEDKLFEVLSTSGDTHLGGDDLDNAIVKWLIEEIKKKSGIDLTQDKKGLQQLREEAVKAKIELSTQETTRIDHPALSIDLSRAALEAICRPLIERSIEPCERAIQDSKLPKSKIDQVVLVGGMTRMPAVQAAVQKIFGKAPNTSVNPDEAVAIGAAIQGGVIAGDINNVLLIDVAPLTLGIETAGGIMTPLIKRNTSIPCQQTQIFSTNADGQSTVKISVFQGERSFTKDNKEIGSFELTGIPPAPKGVPQIAVTFHIDGNGVLQVSAIDQTSGKKEAIKIQAKSGLSKESIQETLVDQQIHEAEDKAILEWMRTQNEANQLIEQVRESLLNHKNTFSAESVAKAEEAIQELQKAIASNQKQSSQEALNQLRKVWQKIFAKNQPNPEQSHST
jgi:molecular chaperone DnaK